MEIVDLDRCPSCGNEFPCAIMHHNIALHICRHCGTIAQQIGGRWVDGPTDEESGVLPMGFVIGRAQVAKDVLAS